MSLLINILIFLNKNLEDQNNYSLKFSEILENMDVFASNNEEIMKKTMNKKMSKTINQRTIMTVSLMTKRKKANKVIARLA